MQLTKCFFWSNVETGEKKKILIAAAELSGSPWSVSLATSWLKKKRGGGRRGLACSPESVASSQVLTRCRCFGTIQQQKIATYAGATIINRVFELFVNRKVSKCAHDWKLSRRATKISDLQHNVHPDYAVIRSNSCTGSIASRVSITDLRENGTNGFEMSRQLRNDCVSAEWTCLRLSKERGGGIKISEQYLSFLLVTHIPCDALSYVMWPMNVLSMWKQCIAVLRNICLFQIMLKTTSCNS